MPRIVFTPSGLTGEVDTGKRVQKFVYKGLGPVTKQNQGTVWPTTR